LSGNFSWNLPAYPRLGVMRSLGLGAFAGFSTAVASPMLIPIAILTNDVWQNWQFNTHHIGLGVFFGLVFIPIFLVTMIISGLIFAPIFDLLLPRWKYAWILSTVCGAFILQLCVNYGNSARQPESPISDLTNVAAYDGGVMAAIFGYARHRILNGYPATGASVLDGESQ
jgi:hypothetical protein